MPKPPTIIERPLHRLGVRTPAEYRKRQAAILAHNRAVAPAKTHGVPWETDEPIAAHIGVSAWRVRCTCGEAPPADPEWQLACCAGCGAIYTKVVFPERREEIEAVLVKRAKFTDRNWKQPWTVEDLQQQNVEHGEAA
jgi:hypothetical protein